MVKVVLVKCNLIDNQYLEKFEISHNLTYNKSYAYLLNVEPSLTAFLKICITVFNDIIMKFTDQNNSPLTLENKVNLTLFINK